MADTPTPTSTAAPAASPPLARSHPLASRERDLGALTGGSVGVRPHLAMVLVRAVAPGPPAQAAEEVLGTPLPTEPNTWASTASAGGGEPGTVVWLGPDEWLVLADEPRPQVLEERLRAALVPAGGSAVDVSAQRLSLRLRGPHARDVLAAGCAVDTHPAVFGTGSSAQTLLGQAGVVLLSRSDAGDDYEVLVRSSFARYLADWLVDASVEHRGADHRGSEPAPGPGPDAPRPTPGGATP